MTKEFLQYLRGALEKARGQAAVAALAKNETKTRAAVAVANILKEVLDQAESIYVDTEIDP